MTTVLQYLFGGYHSQNEAKWMRKLLYAFVIVKCLYWFMDISLLFGENSIVYKNSVQLSSIKSTAFVLFNADSVNTVYTFLICTALFSAFGLFNNHFSRLTAFVIWFLVINIDNAIYPTLTGGDFLLQQLLFFNIFLSGFRSFSSYPRYDADKAVHNAGVLALKTQICLVYFISALAKLMDFDWENGNALFQTFLIHDFSLPIVYNNLEANSTTLRAVSYLIMAYQITFPVLVWYEKFKKPFLAFGVLQHLFIALVMGLPTFGFIMIIAYSIFYFPAFKSKNSL